MSALKFSVLMGVYYGEKPEHLEESIHSIFNNTVIPNELVVVEDGPLTEELYEVLDAVKYKYENLIKIIPLPKNQGLGKALSIGIHECKYDLVARMDADDICKLNRFELELNEFLKDKKLVLVGTYIDEFYNKSNDIIATRKVPLKHEDIMIFAKKRNPFNHVTVMFKKEKILEVGNYRKVYDIGYEDYDLWIRLLMEGSKVKNIDVSTVKVRTGKEMLKRRGNLKRLKTALFFRKSLKDLGFINYFEWLWYSLTTIGFTISPGFIKSFFYKKILRN